MHQCNLQITTSQCMKTKNLEQQFRVPFTLTLYTLIVVPTFPTKNSKDYIYLRLLLMTRKTRLDRRINRLTYGISHFETGGSSACRKILVSVSKFWCLSQNFSVCLKILVSVSKFWCLSQYRLSYVGNWPEVNFLQHLTGLRQPQ